MEVNAIAMVLYSADRGLVGAYNVNVIRKANIDLSKAVRKRRQAGGIHPVGNEARDLMRRFGKNS